MTIRKEQDLENQIQKHMGCMSGFFNVFDRHHFLTGKRFSSAAPFPPPPVAADTPSESEKSTPSSPPENSAPTTLPLPVFESREASRSSWRLRKEAPRLSLDSRATTDAKGSLHPKEIRPDAAAAVAADGAPRHPSPSVIARLMGLDPLLPEPDKKPELRRSASESRVSNYLFQSRFGVVLNPQPQLHAPPDPRKTSVKNPPKGEPNATQRRAPPQRKSFFDSGDIFPEPRRNSTMYGEIEDGIRKRGGSIEPPSEDLEALKQILEALQLKGLLHCKQPSHRNQMRHRNFVSEQSRSRTPINRRIRNGYSPVRETKPSVIPRRERSPANRPAKPKALSVGTQRRRDESPGSRKASPIQSPKLSRRRSGTDTTVGNRLPGNKKPTSETHRKENASNVVVLEDDSSTSGSSITASTDTERPKSAGINLSQRCDEARIPANEAGPSPVSVLDSSFYKDEMSTPSPVTTRRNIDFKACKTDQSGELEEDIWSPPISHIRSKQLETLDDSDFTYISDILRAIHYLPEGSDVFQLLEKQEYVKQSDAYQVRLDRKLIFDTVDEILDRNRRLPPWEAVAPSVDKIWSEIEKLREQCSGEDLLASVCSVLRKDMTGDSVTHWGEFAVEMSEVVLDIERLIFKDLVCDSIGDLGALAYSETLLASVVPKRKLVF